MSQNTLPQSLKAIFSDSSEPEVLFNALLPAVCELLQSDRCFLIVRNPNTRMQQIFCWRQREEFPDMSTAGWQPEARWEKDDPLFAASLRVEDSIFVEDVETASPEVVNVEFERQNFGHRALIHAHVIRDGQLWGILQPCVFDAPRIWSESDRALINSVIEHLTPTVVQYVQSNGF
jgi:GAF domain-containing protein